MPPLETFAKYRWQSLSTVALVSLTELLIVRRVIVTSPPLPSLSTVSTVHRRLGCCYQVYFIKDWTGEVSCQPWIWNKCIDINRAEHDHELLKQNIAEQCVVFVYNTAQRTVSAHCEVALCAEFIEQWSARRAGYSETRVRFPIFPISTLDYWRWGRVAVWL